MFSFYESIFLVFIEAVGMDEREREYMIHQHIQTISTPTPRLKTMIRSYFECVQVNEYIICLYSIHL